MPEYVHDHTVKLYKIYHNYQIMKGGYIYIYILEIFKKKKEENELKLISI